MATANLSAPGGDAAEAFLRERFGLAWGDDVLGIAEDGFSAEQSRDGGGLFKLTLVGRCTREDVEKFVSLLWSVPADTEGEPR